MDLTKLAIKRPITILMVVFIVLVFGVTSFKGLSVDLMPSMEIPVVLITTPYEGAGPSEVENLVTRNIESAAATVTNVDTIQSVSSRGNSMVIVQFVDGTDMDFASLQLREKLDLYRQVLPDGVGDPTVIKMDPNLMPIAQVAITSETMSPVELTNYVKNTVQPRLERLNGIAQVAAIGGTVEEIQITADPSVLSGYGLALGTIASTLMTENASMAAGSVDYGDSSLIVRSIGELTSVSDIENLPVNGKGVILRLGDVASVKEGYKDAAAYSRENGISCISLTIQKQGTANTVDVVNLVKKELSSLEGEKSGLSARLVFDQAQFITMSVNNVISSAVTGFILAIIILFIFLRNIRLTVNIAIAIPISIITTFILVYFNGMTLNVVSLGGLSLGVGMLVDNSIVVLDNIHRHSEEGYPIKDSSYLGTKEVRGAVIASTLTTIVVFLPLVFMEGYISSIFHDLSFTVTFALVASLAVSITLVPMLCSNFLGMGDPDKKYVPFLQNILDGFGNWFERVKQSYKRLLTLALDAPKRTLLIAVVIFIFSICLIPFIGTEFMAASDEGTFTASVQLPPGTRLEETNEITKKVEEIVSSQPEVSSVFTTVESGYSEASLWSSAGGSLSVSLVPKEERRRSTDEVVDAIRDQVKSIAGAKITVTPSNSMMGSVGTGSGISYEISGPDMDVLTDLSKQVASIIKQVDGTREVKTSISDAIPETVIVPDRQLAARYGLTASQISAAVRGSMQGTVATTIKKDGKEIDVRVMYPKNVTDSYEKLLSMPITTPTGIQIPLSAVASIERQDSPQSISRNNQVRYVTVTSQIHGRDLGSITDDINEKLALLNLPSGYTVEAAGADKMMMDAFNSLTKALLLAILLIYMVMAAQFESLLHPFVVMFSVPFALIGVLLSLFITQRTLNVASFIGIIILAGIVVNNAIVLIDYINKLRSRGLSRREAILRAGPTRLRPILMTALTTILGVLPMAIGAGQGGEVMAPLATVVFGGLITSTFLTLIIVPVIYTLFDRLSARITKGKGFTETDVKENWDIPEQRSNPALSSETMAVEN